MTGEALSAGQRRIVGGLVRLLVPDYPDLDAATQETVLRDASDFVCSEIRAMPSYLRLPYKLVIAGFATLAFVRYARRFTSLRADQGRAYLAFWADSRIGPMRDFVKLIRSCALLAYFDHPLVAAQLRRQRTGSADSPTPAGPGACA